MAEKSTLARPYAKAIFELAHAEKDLQGWSDKLSLLSQVSSDEQIASIIGNPDVSNADVISIIESIGGEALDDKGKNLLKVAAENDRLDLMPEISETYELLRAEEEGKIEAEVISAFAVNATQKKLIAEALQKRLGCDVSLTTSIDKDLVGGIIIRAGDLVIDGSVANQLKKITKTLMS